MTAGSSRNHGIEKLVEAYIAAFQIPENLNHYAPDDFEKAQRRFVRFCLRKGFSPAPGEDRSRDTRPEET